MLVEIYCNDGSVLRLSTDDLRASTTGIQWDGNDYIPRLLDAGTAAIQAMSSLGVDVIPTLTLKIADSDRTIWENYEKAKGLTGSLVIVRFVFYDIVNQVFSSDSIVKFIGIAEAPSNDDTTLTLKVTSKMNMAKVTLPWCQFTRNCPWNFPDTSDLVDSSGNYLSTPDATEAAARFQAAADQKGSACWNCGYSPTASGSNARGNLNPSTGKPYTTCDQSSASCLARLGNGSDITKDGSGRTTGRFGGITWQIPTMWSGTPFGSNKSSNYNPNWDNTPVYNQYLPAIYGTAMVYPPVINVVGEANSTRGECVVSLGPLLNIYTCNVNDHDLPEDGGIYLTGGAFPTGFGVDPLHRYSIITTGDRSGALINDAGFADPDPHGGMCIVEWVIFAAEGSSSSPPSIRMVVAGNQIPAFQTFTSISGGWVNVSPNLIFGGTGMDVVITGTGTSIDGNTYQIGNNWTSTGFQLSDSTVNCGVGGYVGAAVSDSAQSLGSTPTGMANSDNSNVAEQFIGGIGANPIWTIMDVMIKAAWQYTDFDMPSCIASAAICDRQITRTDGSTGPLFSTSLAIKDPKPVSEIVRGLRLACRATIAPSRTDGSKIGIQIDGTLADQQPSAISGSNYNTPVTSVNYAGSSTSGYVAYRFSDDDGTIIRKGKKSSLTITQQQITNSYNSVNFNFCDSQNSYVDDAVTVRDSMNVNLVGQEVKYTLPVMGINTYDQAQRIGAWFLATKLEGNPRGDSGGTWTFKFDTSFRAIHLRIGDIIMVNSVHDGITNALARVISITPTTNFETITIEATWHSDEWYLDAFGTSNYSLAPTVAASLQRPPLPWVPNQASPVNTLDPFGQYNTFDISQIYQNQQGALQPQIVVNGAVPVTQSSTNVVPPLFDMVPTSNTGVGTIQGGQNYAICVCTYDSSNLWSRPSNVSNVQLASGTNSYSLKLTGLDWQQLTVNGTSVVPSGFGVWMGPDNNNMTLQSTSTSLPSSITLGAYSTSGIGLPDSEFDHWTTNVYKARHTGSVGAQVSAVSSSSITTGGTSWTSNCFAGRVVSIIAEYGTGILTVKNYAITGNNATTLYVTGNPQGDDVTIGDVFVIRLGVSSATTNSITDSAISGSGASLTVNGEARNLVWIFEGKGAGQIFPILSNTGTSVTIAGQWSIVPDATSYWIVTEPTLYSQDSTSMPMTMDVANEAGSTVVVRVDTVDATGQACVTNLSPMRDIYIWGAQGTRTVTASTTQLNTDGRVFGNAAAGNMTHTLLASGQVYNQELFLQKIGTDANTWSITCATGDTFSNGNTTIMLTNPGDSVLLQF